MDLPEWAVALDLRPHPEGGFFAETWRSPVSVPMYGGTRSVATSIYFLLVPGQRSKWHVVRSDELWLWHRGGPVTLLLGGPEDASEVRLGPAIENGERPLVHVPAGVRQATLPVAEAVLVTCIVAPGFDYADFTMLE